MEDDDFGAGGQREPTPLQKRLMKAKEREEDEDEGRGISDVVGPGKSLEGRGGEDSATD